MPYTNSKSTLTVGKTTATIYRLDSLDVNIDALPYSIRILLENALRNCDNFEVTEKDVLNIASWKPGFTPMEIPFKPARVILQDFTGVPCVVDLAAMRNAMNRLGGNPDKINPLVPVDLVIDHSVQTDYFGTDTALQDNLKMEFHRNKERYEFLRWGQQAFQNFRIVPPSSGIIHQVNLEYLAKGVFVKPIDGENVAVVDTVVGTDSHTVMINGLGVLGWGVGGIEAEAVMLGQPLYMLLPEVVGVELTGTLRPEITATDVVLTITNLLRKVGVVGKFVEFFGEGVQSMKLADRAVIANMGPEYGATMGFFPTDDKTIEFLRQTGRSEEEVAFVEAYTKEQKLFRSPDAPTPQYTKVVTLDLSTVEPCLAGPKRPQDKVLLSDMQSTFKAALTAPVTERGFGLDETDTARIESNETQLGHGCVTIAAITSCTNTSSPSVMLGAGLLAKKAVEKGLKTKPWVKTSLGPGSRAVTDYLKKAGLTDAFNALGFQTVGYGCLTCIGNSGPLPEPVAKQVTDNNLVAAAVVSANRNFEGRVNPLVKANFLASPALVVAYAIAGTVNINLVTDPLETDKDGNPVYLKDLWPTREEIDALTAQTVQPDMFLKAYANVFEGSDEWKAVESPSGSLFPWNLESTYIQEPPFLAEMTAQPEPLKPINGARVLLALGDSITTDHISPAGNIKADSPAGKYLQEHDVEPKEFNSYGSRRGADKVMTRGTFANIRIRNFIAPGTEGGWSRYLPDGKDAPAISVYDAAVKYKQAGIPLIVLAGAEYGTGSSRDWAAKGTSLLGVRAVIAASFERIHRSNLVGMGILPLQFKPGQTWQSLGLTGEETFDLGDVSNLTPQCDLTVTATAADGKQTTFDVTVRIDTPVEIVYFKNGGILQTVLRKLANN